MAKFRISHTVRVFECSQLHHHFNYRLWPLFRLNKELEKTFLLPCFFLCFPLNKTLVLYMPCFVLCTDCPEGVAVLERIDELGITDKTRRKGLDQIRLPDRVDHF